MKLFLLFISLLWLTTNVSGQTIQHKFFINTECNDTIQLFKDYLLSKGNHNYHPDQNGICSLPDTGTYYFLPNPDVKQIFSLTAVPIIISTFGFKIDTLQTIDLYPIIILHSKDPTAYKYEHWTYCGEPANGYLKDYTLTGHREGTFKKGKAVKTVEEYNKSGELIFISYYSSKGRLKKTERVPYVNKSGEW